MATNNVKTEISNGKNLEELSREELIHLLQKDKQILEKVKADKEIIETLTKQKLHFVGVLDELKIKNTALESKLVLYDNELKKVEERLNVKDNENVSYQRQVKRLTDENEQLLENLEDLEKQIDELNKIGIQQREQLLELEKSRIQESGVTQNSNKVAELQNMLKVSLEEIKKLKHESIAFQEKNEKWNITLAEKDKSIKTIGEELQKCTKELNELKRKDNKSDLQNEKIAQLIVDKQKLSDRQKELEENNTKLKEKVKSFHSKLVKFAGNCKALKEEKNQILQIFRTYTEQVKHWKDQLSAAGQQLVALVNKLEEENELLKSNNLKTNENSDSSLEKMEIEKGRLLEKIDFLEKEKENIAIKLKEVVTKHNEDMKMLVDEKQKENTDLKKHLEEHQTECLLLRKELEESKKANNNIFKLQKEIDRISQSKEELLDQNDKYKNSIENLEKQLTEKELELSQYKEENKQLKENFSVHEANLNKLFENEINILKNHIQSLQNDIEHSKSTDQQLAERSSEEIIKLVQENKELLETNEKFQNKLEEFERKMSNTATVDTQTEGEYSKDYEDQINTLRNENGDLLREMNEMNQVLKERGESISKLNAHCEEIMKKLQVYETQANKNVDNISKKEETIKQLEKEIEELKSLSKKNADEEVVRLKKEVEFLKERVNSNLENSYAESESMSTSTISKVEDSNRMKDLEGSWEERYGKLRNLALKLKGKIREQTAQITSLQTDKEDIHNKLTNSLKLVQTVQNDYDKKVDELEQIQKENKKYLEQLNSVAEGISKDKQALVSNDEIIIGLKNEIEELKLEKKNTETWKKQVSAKIQTLRKELEANNVLKKDFEQKISNLNSELESKDKALKAEIESHKHTQNLLEQSKNDCKKNSVLSLEMQDYERSVKELSQKLDKKQEQITNLQTQVESQKSTVNALREQNKILEERIQNEESDLTAASSEINSFKQKISTLEETIRQKEEKIFSVTKLLETARSENEELSTELSKVIAEHQKSTSTIKSERDHLRSQILGLQQSLRDAQDTLKLKEDELSITKSDYENYKVRAQSVLRQNQNRDVGLEEKLSEEVTTLKAKNEAINSELTEIKSKMRDLEAKCTDLCIEKDGLVEKRDELEYEVEELKNQYAQLNGKYQKAISEHSEAVRSLKLHAETLSQCYRQKISEQEVRHNREIIELQSKLEKAPSPSEPLPAPPGMPREEGEGSESVDSNPPANTYPVPLERLLGSDSDQEVAHMKKQLGEQEAKVGHLTALLADTEQDLAKHVQMNKLLKEEIRRQQRSEEREKHAENLEYLKNVVFKFITLSGGDERSRLVPVLNTILNLSPEERQKLTAVAKGDPGKGWSTYLPTWPSPNKPQ